MRKMNYWLCDDCTIAEVNGDYSGMSDERAAEVAYAFRRFGAQVGGYLAANFDVDTGDGYEEFWQKKCSICQSGPGRRHRFTIFPVTQAYRF
jgi:hypothetical protein